MQSEKEACFISPIMFFISLNISSLRTVLIGTGSDKRRKAIISRAIGSEVTFAAHRREFRRRQQASVSELRASLASVVNTHLLALIEEFDIIRIGNAAREAERDPEFRGRVQEKVACLREEMKQIELLFSETTTGPEEA